MQQTILRSWQEPHYTSVHSRNHQHHHINVTSHTHTRALDVHWTYTGLHCEKHDNHQKTVCKQSASVKTPYTPTKHPSSAPLPSPTSPVSQAGHKGHTGPGGFGIRGSRRWRQARKRSVASSCTCSAQVRQVKCPQTPPEANRARTRSREMGEGEGEGRKGGGEKARRMHIMRRGLCYGGVAWGCVHGLCGALVTFGKSSMEFLGFGSWEVDAKRTVGSWSVGS